MTRFPNKTRLGLLSIALVGGINLASSAFAVEALPQGYQLAAAEKAGEGKCGEGKWLPVRGRGVPVPQASVRRQRQPVSVRPVQQAEPGQKLTASGFLPALTGRGGHRA